jgi:hypothetical protein
MAQAYRNGDWEMQGENTPYLGTKIVLSKVGNGNWETAFLQGQGQCNMKWEVTLS